jgi:hypothetical protein
MADMMADAASFLADQLADNLSQTVTYTRGGQEIAELAATKGASITEIDTTFGVLRIVGTTWYVKASLLVYQGVTWTPRKNDVIEQSGGQQWLVLSENGEKEARESDPFGYLWRINTKRIEA